MYRIDANVRYSNLTKTTVFDVLLDIVTDGVFLGLVGIDKDSMSRQHWR